MKRLLLTFSFFLATFFSFAQYANDWINYDQQYYKLQITETGIHKIGYDALLNSGFPVTSVDPRNIQMFGRGEELHIHIEGEADGQFDPNDYIEFYAQRNTGYFDEDVYDQPQNHGNPYYSLFNDTATYFITWNNSINNNRLAPETDVNFSNYSTAPYILKENVSYYANKYYFGRTYSLIGGTTDPRYTAGEGWFGNTQTLGQNFNRPVNTSGRVTSGPDAKVKISVIGASSGGITNNHHLRINLGGNNLVDTLYDGYTVTRYNETVPTSQLSNGNTNFQFQLVNDQGATSSNNTVPWLSVKYPRNMSVSGSANMGGIFVPDAQGQSKARLDFTGFNTSGTTARLYDLTNHKRITVAQNGGSLSALVPNSGGEKECFLTSDNDINNHLVTELELAGANGSGYYTDFEDFIINPNFIIISHQSLWAEAQNYKSYRDLTGYNSLLMDIEELYDQFAHGIRKHPLSIRNFAEFMLNEWGQDTSRHIFLIGKSISFVPLGTTFGSIDARHDPTYNSQVLVPSFGYPTCDILMTAGMGGTLNEPAIPIGRLAAKNVDEVRSYLDKVIEYEGNQPAEWMKRVMHFCGGSDGNENDLLCYYVDNYQDTIEGSFYGAFVQKFEKTNSQPFQITQADSIRELIESGTSLMTFFGHAAGGGFDVSTDDPSNYDNEGKYPLIFGNSCLSGDIHNAPGFGVSVSEPWVLIDDKGAIGFIASVGISLTQALNIYGGNLYHHLCKEHYGSTIGNIMKYTVQDVQQPNNYVVNFPALQTTLHGDPAVVINAHSLPDLSIKEPDIYYEPSEVTTESDSFDVNIIITNLGRTFEDTFTVEVRRTFPNGIQSQPVYRQMPPVYYKDTLTVRLPVDPIFGLGLNQLCIQVDSDFIIDELSETNNQLCTDFLVQTPDIVPVYPHKFAIVPDQGITLKASTGDPFAPEKTYVFQLDTTDLFNSPLMETTTVTQSGGVVIWTPNLLANMPDSTVYFWRTGLDSTIYGEYNWRESSFQYIPGKYGWGQAHFFQYKEDNYNFIIHNRPTRTFDFINTPKSISVHNEGYPVSDAQGFDILYKIDSEVQDYLACGGGTIIFQPQIIVAVVDPNTLEPWGSPGTDPVTGQMVNQQNFFGQLNANGSCGRSRSEKFFFWRQNNANSMANLADFLTNDVPDSAYVLAYSWIVNPNNIYGFPAPGTFQPWNTSQAHTDVLNAFQNLGFDALDTIPLTHPWAFFTKKGNAPDYAHAVVGNSPTSVIDLSAEMDGTWYRGDIKTPLIGPASEWNWMYWDQHPQESPTPDTINLTVSGVRLDGTEQVVIPEFQITNDPDSLELTNLINHSEFPYLKFKAFTKDDSTRTPAQLDRWQVIYEGVPEAALNPSIHFAFDDDTLDQFQDLIFSTTVENIGDYDMDSLLVHYWIEDNNHVRHDIQYPRQAPLLINDILIDTITVATDSFPGINKFWVEVNPDNDQLEQYHFNNIGFLKFNVNGDDVNPILDVTFDGVHILDGDIVSAKPHITIKLDDENPHLIMDQLQDTSLFQVFLVRPNSSQYEPVYFENNSVMQFTPATAPENVCQIDYQAEFAEDGIYELYVQATDKAGNQSGDLDYHITFEVINKSTITEVLNYPNPFSTSTKFVFVLTGSRLPSYFKIQVMTITGKVVRELTMDDLGPMRIGRNITEYAWNGKDKYGDQLANGIYLYRVIAHIDGLDIEHRESGADKFIHSGFGKMYLMR